MPITLPQDVVDSIQYVFGERGGRWLAELPAVVNARCDAWGLEVIGEGFSGGTHSYAAAVRRGDGSVAVLKVPVVDEENVGEPTGLFCYRGEGAIRLYEFDAGSGAMLLEWARPGTELVKQPGFPSLEGRPENIAKVELACRLYRRLRREPVGVPDEYPALPAVRDLVAEWTSLFVDPVPAVAQVIPAPLLERAVEWCEELKVPDGPLPIVNRDTHLGNVLAAEREPWLLIDPKAYFGEAAFDAGFLVMIQVQCAPGLEHARTVVERTAALLDVDAGRARGWAFMRAMEEIVWADAAEDLSDLRLHSAVAAALA
ncbi:aminoglycoside phosphotransferase family protein [Nocardia sp. NPDC049220]|uniref:aminoglycoside phosphotransferase family protein n=1 Tax=Nocardia sp. NPDC049220 TaxID=3155273 RepID=UPI0033D55921